MHANKEKNLKFCAFVKGKYTFPHKRKLFFKNSYTDKKEYKIPRFDLSIKIFYASLILDFATWGKVFDSLGMCVLTCCKEVSTRSALGEGLGCHFVQPLVVQRGTLGPREGTPMAQLVSSSKW